MNGKYHKQTYKINHRLLKIICSICDKELISIMYRNSSNRQERYSSKEKQWKDLTDRGNAKLTEEEMQNFNLHMKECSTSLKIRNIQINAMRCKALAPYLQSQNLKHFQRFFSPKFCTKIHLIATLDSNWHGAICIFYLFY